VVVLPDNDDAGRKHSEQVAESLHDVAESVRILSLPGLDEKGDVSDFLNNGGAKDKLLKLAENTPLWKPAKGKTKRSKSGSKKQGGSLSIQSAEGRTEVANGRRFAQQNENNVRFCHAWGKWIGWDGKRWKLDDTGAIERLAKQVADAIWNEAQASDSDTARRFAAQSASKKGITAMLSLASSEPGIPILPEALDKNTWLLNVQNGTIDLRTGELREHRRDDLITKICPVAFKPDAGTYEWDKFLEGVFDGDSALISFVQRLFGYALSGDVREQILPIFWGGGSNGKTTLLNAFMDVIGTDYSIKLGRDFLVTKRQEGHATERMDLFGKRLAVCSETDDGRRLAEGLVKELCGGDVIRGRRMREDSWEYQPTHKLILCTNHKPTIKGTDHAIWRRLALVPFNVQFWNPDKAEIGPDELRQNKGLPEKLKAESEGILAWAAQGCLDWQREGLGNPPAVKSATDKYRGEQDLVGTFINERCRINDICKVKAKDLFADYERWADETGEPLIKQRVFGRALTQRGFTRFTNNGTWYRGIGLTDGTTE
jgi:putative DNA primase/helicase